MVIHRLTNQTVGSETYLQKTTYRGKQWREIIIRSKCWRKSWAVQRGAQGKAWAVLDLRSLNGHLGILFICPEIPDGLKLKEKYLHTYPKDQGVQRYNVDDFQSVMLLLQHGQGTKGVFWMMKMTLNHMLRWGKWSLMLFWIASPGWNISVYIWFMQRTDAVPSAGEQWDGNTRASRWEGDQDSTLVFWESTSCMITASVLTPLSLSKADSSVMLSYGGRDDGNLIDFPWSLRGEKRGSSWSIRLHLTQKSNHI